MPNEKLTALVANIAGALDRLTTLEIVTVVGQAARDGKGKLDVEQQQESKSIVTIIKLLEGDITTIISPELLAEEYAGLRDFHAAREARGHEITSKNLETLRSLFNLARDLNNNV